MTFFYRAYPEQLVKFFVEGAAIVSRHPSTFTVDRGLLTKVARCWTGVLKYDAAQARDDHGRWTSSGQMHFDFVTEADQKADAELTAAVEGIRAILAGGQDPAFDNAAIDRLDAALANAPEASRRAAISQFGGETAATVYHGTQSDVIDSIKQHGIEVGRATGADTYAAQMGNGMFVQAQVGERSQSVFLTPNVERAAMFAQYAAELHDANPVVVEVAIPREAWNNLRVDERGMMNPRSPVGADPTFLRFRGKIQPEWITQVYAVSTDTFGEFGDFNELIPIGKADVVRIYLAFAIKEPVKGIKKAKRRTLYVRRDLLNGQELIDWAKANGFKTTVPPEQLHVTVAFSKKPMLWSEPTSFGNVEVPVSNQNRMVEPLGDGGAVVLRFVSSELEAGWQKFIDAGASWDYEGYKPHVTISWDATDVDLSVVEPFTGPLIFGPEVFEEIKEDWHSTITEKFDPNQSRDSHGRWAGSGSLREGDNSMVGGPSFLSTTPQTFIMARDRSSRQSFLSPLSVSDLANHRLYLGFGGKVGYALDTNNDLQNVFNNGGPKGAGRQAILDSVRNGAETLDAFEGHLTELYSQYGFTATSRVPFNDEYVPPGWDYARYGRPDVVFMVYQGGDRATIGDRVGTFAGYGIGDGQSFSDYDGAKAAQQRARLGKQADTGRASGAGVSPEPDRRGGVPEVLERHQGRGSVHQGLLKFDPSQARDEHGRWTSTGSHPGVGYSDGAVLRNGKIITSSVEDAVLALHNNHAVELDQPHQVSTLIDRLAEVAREAELAGKEARNYDLCNVSVKGSNLFCVDSKGIPRVNMPQLKGIPVKGSRADALPHDARGEVDISEYFHSYLEEKGYGVENGTEAASFLRATQNELNGVKVAGIANAIRNNRLDNARLFVSSDNYIVDGHHRWAATVGVDFDDNRPGDLRLDVARVNIDIITLLDESRSFAHEWGLPQVAVKLAAFRQQLIKEGVVAAGVRLVIDKIDHKNREIIFKFDPNQARDDHGRWAASDGGGFREEMRAQVSDWAERRKGYIGEIAEKMGFPAGKVKFGEKLTFSVNGREIQAGATYDNNTGEITIYKSVLMEAHLETGIAPLMAHEITHAKWQKFGDMGRSEIAAAKAAGVYTVDNGFKSEVAATYPLGVAWHQVSRDNRFLDTLEESDGITPYSDEYWSLAVVVRQPRVTSQAINETLAEMASVEYKEPGTLQRSMARRPGSAWGDLYATVQSMDVSQ